MRLNLTPALLLAVLASCASLSIHAQVEKPANLIADGIPAVPLALAATTRPYMEYRTASFLGWNTQDHSLLISTRFGNVAQLHVVAKPQGARTQISFENEPIKGSWSPKGDVLVVSKDSGGDEFFQLYSLQDGRLTLLTDGKSRNQFNVWSRDGRWIAYSSTLRNGTDSDLYVMDPRNKASARRVLEAKGGGWSLDAFAPDGNSAIVSEYLSVTHTRLWQLNLTTLALTPIGQHSKTIAYGISKFAPDGTLWAVSDEDADFARLGTLDIRSGKFTPVNPEPKWDVSEFDISKDGKFIAYLTNEAGISRLKLLDLATRQVRTVSTLPSGTGSGVEIAPWGEVGLSYTTAKAPGEAYSVDPASLQVTRWTYSETGGLDPQQNVEPELIEITSFDGEKISGFLYRPDARKFPGARPLLFNVHGGPEGQTTPGFLGRNNYLVNELGIAVFFPNVRGSTGFGKRFVSLDNGPFLRENSVRDIGAFIDHLGKDKALDAAKVALTGGSYGGYMCYASAIHFVSKLKSATCIVAISNFVSFLENTQSYRRDLRRVEYGDERDPAQRAKLLAISPMTRVKELKIPLLVVTGANDPRVPKSEADQMVAAVRANDQKVCHLIGNDEGHGFAKKANVDYQFLVTMMFWQKTLLGGTPTATPARSGDCL